MAKQLPVVFWWGWLAVFLTCACGVQAHDRGLSTAEVTVDKETIMLLVSFAPQDVSTMLAPRDRPVEWNETEMTARQPALKELGAMLYSVKADGSGLAFSESTVELVPGDRLQFRFIYPKPMADSVEFRALNLGALPDTHREYFSGRSDDGTHIVTLMLSAVSSAAVMPLKTSAAMSGHAGGTFGGFLLLGIEHIWTGYDHLLFLFGMLLVCRTLRSVAVIITAFTVAHSLTLAMATLGWISLPGSFVEPAIAASIIYVGVENLLRKGKEPRGRGWLTFAFGLVHGFGFASVLADLGVGRDGSGIVQPLLAFNLGVELGQLAVAAVVLPLLLRLRRYPVVDARLIPASSIVIALAGTWWLLERVCPA